MRIADSRVMGLFPLQHEGFKDNSPPWDLDKRASIFGIRIKDRFDKANQAGHWKYDSESVGDIHGGQLFKKDTREVPMWRFATGVVVTRSGNPSVATPGNNSAPPVATPSGGSPNKPVATQSPNQNFYSPANSGGQVAGPPGEGDRSVGGEAPGGGQGSGVLNGTVPTVSTTPTAEGMGAQLVYSPSTTSASPGAMVYSPNTVSGANPLSAPGGALGPVDPNQRFGNVEIPSEPTGGTAIGSNPTGPEGGGPAVCRPIIGAMEVAPILDENYGPDLRLKKIKPSILQQAGKAAMARAAIGSLGITLTANEENRQIDLFFPCDGRLIAVNYAGDVRCGSLVCDLTPDSEIDPDRTSPLQALTWVIKKPNGGPNTLAWNIGPTGCGDTEGGMVIDDPDGGGGDGATGAPVATPTPRPSNPPVATPGASSGGGTGPGQTQVMPGLGSKPNEDNGGPVVKPGGGKQKVVAWASRHHNGPLDVGSGRCRHVKGRDADGHPISPLHIQWQFLLRENDAHDGPLNITRYKPGKDFDQVAQVYFGWNEPIKKWDWWTTVPIYYCPAPTPSNPTCPMVPTPYTIVPMTVVPSVATPSGGKINNNPNGGTTPNGLAPVGTPSNPIRVGDVANDLGGLFGTGTVATGGDVNKPNPPGTTGGTTGGSSVPTEPTHGIGLDKIDPFDPDLFSGEPLSPEKPGSFAPPTGGGGTSGGDGPQNPQPGDIVGYTPDGIPIRQPPAGYPVPPPQNTAGGTSMSPNPQNFQNVPFLMGSFPFASQNDLAKPVNYSSGKPNMNTPNANTNVAGTDAATSAAQAAATAGPVTGSMVAFGGEGGATGSGGYASNTGAQGDPWVYTTLPGSSTYPCGTGPGGWCILPPEVSMQLARSHGLVPQVSSLPRSTVYFITGPGAWFGAGVPELGNGTMKDGYIWGYDIATGDLVWKTHSNSQAATEAIRFTRTGQNIKWKSGTTFTGEIEHTNTANRVYTFPDISGTLAIALTGSGAPAANAPESTFYWDTTADALYVNNNGSTGWTAIGSGSGITAAESMILKTFFSTNGFLPANTLQEETYTFPAPSTQLAAGTTTSRSQSTYKLTTTGANVNLIYWDIGSLKSTVLMSVSGYYPRASDFGIFFSDAAPATNEVPNNTYIFDTANGAFAPYKYTASAFTILSTAITIDTHPTTVAGQLAFYYDDSSNALICWMRRMGECWTLLFNITDSSFTTMRYCGIRISATAAQTFWVQTPLMIRYA